MADILSDGSVVPSYIQTQSSAQFNQTAFEQVAVNVALRIGYIVAIHYPKDPGYESNRFTLYDVACLQNDGFGGGSYNVYKGVRAMFGFGSGTDVIDFTLRGPATPFQGVVTPDLIKDSSRVLLLCLNGRSSDPIIIGCTNHPFQPDDSKDLGHHFKFVFNGINFDINKDGELKLVYNGATNNAGEVTGDPTASGSTFELTKDGSMKLYNDTEKITIDHVAKTVEIDSKSNVIIKSAGVLTGAATDNTMLGTTYRASESAMHSAMTTTLGSLTGMLAAAGAALTAASGLHNIPVAGPILAAPILATAGASLTAASALTTALSTEIAQFEAKTDTYLSKVNISD